MKLQKVGWRRLLAPPGIIGLFLTLLTFSSSAQEEFEQFGAFDEFGTSAATSAERTDVAVLPSDSGEVFTGLHTEYSGDFVRIPTATERFTLQRLNWPSSPKEPRSSWESMTPSAFLPRIESAYEQCYRTASRYYDDFLEQKYCERLMAKLVTPEQYVAKDQCRFVWVKDGIVFDYMNVIRKSDGEPAVSELLEKALGRDDLALLCPLEDDVHAYWFIGQETSCNNVGFVHAFQGKPLAVVPLLVEEPPVETVVLPVPVDPPQRFTGTSIRIHTFDGAIQNNTSQSIIFAPRANCPIPGYSGGVGISSSRTSTLRSQGYHQ